MRCARGTEYMALAALQKEKKVNFGTKIKKSRAKLGLGSAALDCGLHVRSTRAASGVHSLLLKAKAEKKKRKKKVT